MEFLRETLRAIVSDSLNDTGQSGRYSVDARLLNRASNALARVVVSEARGSDPVVLLAGLKDAITLLLRSGAVHVQMATEDPVEGEKLAAFFKVQVAVAQADAFFTTTQVVTTTVHIDGKEIGESVRAANRGESASPILIGEKGEGVWAEFDHGEWIFIIHNVPGGFDAMRIGPYETCVRAIVAALNGPSVDTPEERS